MEWGWKPLNCFCLEMMRGVVATEPRELRSMKNSGTSNECVSNVFAAPYT